MNTITEAVLAQLKMDFYKTWTTVNLSIIIGEVALLNTFYKTSELHIFAYLSIGSFILAIFFGLGVMEVFINRHSIKYNETNEDSIIYKATPKNKTTEYIFSVIEGLLTGVGFAGFFIFLIFGNI